MNLISILVVLIIVGFVLYLVRLIPMEPIVKNIIYAVTVLFLVLWVLQQVGLLGSLDLRLK